MSSELAPARMGDEDMGIMHFDSPHVKHLSRQDLKVVSTVVLTGYREGGTVGYQACHSHSCPWSKR